MWLMGLPTLRQCCFFPALVVFFFASSYSELQGVRPREDMTTLVRTNLLHPLFSSPETSPTQWEMGPVWPFNSPPESSREKDRYVSSSLSLPPLCCHCAHQSCLETITNTFFLSVATGSRRGKREGTWPWCWKWIQCALVFIYDLTNELPVSSETALKERLGRQAIKRLWRPLKCCKIPLSLQFNLLLTAQHQTREWQYLDHALNLDAMTGRCCVWEVRKCKWLLVHTVQPPPFVQAKLRWPLIWGTFQTRVY